MAARYVGGAAGFERPGVPPIYTTIAPTVTAMYFSHHDERTLGSLTERRLRREWCWNIWSTRMQPYEQLTDGDEIGVVVTNASGSTIAYLGNVSRLLKAPIRGKADAISTIAAHTTLNATEVGSNPYTARQRDRPGYVLAYRLRNVRPLGLPRPVTLTIQRHGWGWEHDTRILRSWGVASAARHPQKPPPQRSGQGWRNDAIARAVVEEHAMQLAHQWLVDGGYVNIQTVAARKSWDFEAQARRNGPIRRVEVKGTTGTGLKVNVTRNEVAAAQDGSEASMMVIVNGIRLSRSEGTVVASGGDVFVVDPWIPSAEDLRVESYTWTPPRVTG